MEILAFQKEWNWLIEQEEYLIDRSWQRGFAQSGTAWCRGSF